MAKKIIATNYVIDGDSDKITVKGFYRAEQIQLITDVTPDTGGTILYNFADTTKGHKSVTFDTVLEETTIQLEQDLSALNIDSTSNLQIIVDTPENEIEVSDALLDPVHKIRVSTPENLIDTDFEYGLQPTKWETLELSNNVPSFFVGDGDAPLNIVNRVEARLGSDLIKVVCNDQHNLVVGTPIDVSGLSNRTAEGKYLVSAADSNNFFYRANSPQTYTGEIGSIYTAVTPGSFYAGSQIQYTQDSSIQTDGADPSKVTIHTEDIHGFADGSQFYLVNTVASKTLKIQDSGGDTATDSRPFIDHVDKIDQTISLDLSKTRTTQIKGRWNHYFNNDAIDTSANTITWTGHQLRTNYTLIYNPPAGGAQIGGLNRFDIYYVRYVDADTIELSSTYNGAAISFTGAGDDSYAQHSLHLIYEIRYSNANYANSYTYNYPWAWQFGADASGYDLRTYTDNSYGLGAVPDGVMMMTYNYAYPANSTRFLSYYLPEYQNQRNIYGGNHHLYNAFPSNDPNAPTNQPSRWNPIEDFERYRNYSWQSYNTVQYNSIRTQKYYYHGTYNYYWTNKRVFAFPFIYDNEGDTFYAEDHGLENGSSITFTTKSGTAPQKSTSTTSIANTGSPTTVSNGAYNIVVKSPDRFQLQNTRLVEAKGDSDGAYEIIGEANNRTANSFFVANHGLIDNQTVTFKNTGSPTLPATPTGAVLPITAAGSAGNMPKAFATVDNYLSSYFGSLSNHKNFTTANHSGNSNILTYNGLGSTGNNANSPINQINTWYTTSYLEIYKAGRREFYGYPTSQQLQLGNANSTTPLNVFGTGSGSEYGVFRMATDWQQNTSIPYYFEMNAASDNAYTPGNGNTNSWWMWYNYSYTGHYSVNPITANFYQTYTYVTGGKTYEYEYAVTTAERGTSAYTQLNFVFRNNTDWDRYTSHYLHEYSYGNSSYRVHYSFSRMHQAYQCRLWFFGNQNLNFSNANAKTLVEGIIADFHTNFTNPSLTANNDYSVNVINDNRFSLKDGGSEVDIITSGVGINDSNQLQFSLSEVQGAADGSYTADSVGERFIKLTVPFELSGNSEVLDADNIDSSYNIPIANGHPYVSGTKVRYEVGDGSTALTNLVDSNDYYVFAVDDNNVQLMEDLQDALSGSNPIEVAADSANASHTITTDSIAGRIEATGTVTIEIGSKKVVGDQTLFKRFFKAGDTIYIKDDAEDPGRLYKFEVAIISDDENMELTSEAITAGEDLKHFAQTNAYAKPDGYSVHRPFDGGVEIGAGTAPLSQITRQTRKYFRYQSGKGIQTSLAINFNPPVIMETVTSRGTTVTVTTKYPHRLSVDMDINVVGASDTIYNGDQTVASIVDDYKFTYTTSQAPQTTIPGGIIQFTVRGFSGAFVRAGMFDNQNGFFFEWDGTSLKCVRRSSTTQISGTCAVTKNSGKIVGTNTNFSGQLVLGEKVVLRGQTYKVVAITDRNEMFVQPQYRGVSSNGVIVTKTIDVKVPQESWNLDKCDGSGPQGFNLDKTKIQMAYMDYSWYGAGKIRFGFKDRKGHIRYVHEFIHNNRLDEAYMRSGNLPAKYEIENDLTPTYSPTLFHWGTSVIMDGTFDDDKAYLFTAPSKSLTFTNGQSVTANTTGNSSLSYRYNRGTRQYDFYVRIPFGSADATKFTTGTKLYGTGLDANGEEVAYTDYSGSTFRVHIYVSSGFSFPPTGSYSSVTSGTTINVGQAASGGADLNLGIITIPLVSLRLAPSVDNNLTGNLGERDIINRMQLKLNEVGLILTHDCEVALILNGDISTVTWGNVDPPSLSQLIKHEQGDQITGGTEVFSFRAAGGADGATNQSNFPLGDIIDMGNSILGGDGIFPNGPDILTVAVRVVNTAPISASQPFSCSSRITWSESQA